MRCVCSHTGYGEISGVSQAEAREHDHGPEQHRKFKEGSHKTGPWNKVSKPGQDEKHVYMGKWPDAGNWG